MPNLVLTNPMSLSDRVTAIQKAVMLDEAQGDPGITQLTGAVTAGPGSGSQVATAVKIPPNVALTGTPTPGQVPTATTGTAATWQNPNPTNYPPTKYLALGALAPIGLAILAVGGAAAFTLAIPAHDGDVLILLSIDGQRYTVTTPVGAINGTKTVLAFGGAIGDSATLIGYGGVWYIDGTPSGVTAA